MKKTKIGLMIIIFIIIVITALNSIAATGTATVNSLRVRQKPDKNSEIIEIISVGQRVEILGVEGDWYKVRYNNVVGYVSKTYISTTDVINTDSDITKTPDTSTTETSNSTTDTSTSTETTTPDTTTDTTTSPTNNYTTENLSQKTVKVVKDAQLCILPSAVSTKTSTIKANSTVKVIYDFGIWVKVDSNGQQGWLTKNVVSTD